MLCFQSSNRSQFEAPPPPRFEMTASYDRGTDKRDRDRDYKRDYPRHVSCKQHSKFYKQIIEVKLLY